MSMENRISLTVENHIAHVRLVRADKMNALDTQMFEAFAEVGQRLQDDKDIRVVVLSGEGKAFCAGLDVSNFGAMASAGADGQDSAESVGGRRTLEQRTHGITNTPQHAAWVWRQLPVPVIVVLHGVAYGGGTQIALGADMRYATPDVKMSVMEIKWGLVPDMGGTQLIRHLVRDDVNRELTYTGRVFTGEEALQMGMVTRVCEDPLAEAMETAAYIATRNPDAIRADKRLLNSALYNSAEEGLLEESREQDKLIGSPNQVEAVMAEFDKRPAKFS